MNNDSKPGQIAYTLKQVAQLIGDMTTDRVKALIGDKEDPLPTVSLPGRVKVLHEDLMDYLRRHRVIKTTEPL